MAVPPFGGDEVNAIVVEVGSHTCKAGFAGEDTPKVLFESIVGEVSAEHRSDPMDTDEPASSSKENVKAQAGADAREPPKRDAAQGYSARCCAAAANATGPQPRCRAQLRAADGEHPLLIAEPAGVSSADRERAVEVLFEDFGAPAVFLAKSAVLSSFSLGRQSSLVVDIGHHGTTVAAVQDGYVLHGSLQRSHVGGALLTQALHASLKSKGAEIHPWYQYSKVAKLSGAGTESVLRELPNVAQSQLDWATSHIVADIKETLCRTNESPFVEEENMNIPVTAYELPDGSMVEVGVERFKITECMFNTAVLRGIEGVQSYAESNGVLVPSVPQLVVNSVDNCDADIRKDMWASIVVTGGSSLFNGTKERLERDLLELAPAAAKVKVSMHPNLMERRFSVWIGGSILGCLGTFHQLWMSKAEYGESGAQLIHRKSP